VTKSTEDELLDEDGFLAPPDDQGLSLDELARAYADLLGRGEDPYRPAPGDEPPEELDDDAEPQEGLTAESAADRAAPDGCDITPLSILEAIVFVGHPENEPLTSETIASLMRGVRPREIDEMVVELNEHYAGEGCPYHVESVGAGYRLALRDEFGSLRDKFYGRVKAAKLSQAAIDVLAIVAYKQPMTREQVDQLRGKPSAGLLSQLVRRELLRVVRSEEKPRTARFATTDRFLQLFGLEHLSDLPNSPD
jgi:segregation and condensation protein B